MEGVGPGLVFRTTSLLALPGLRGWHLFIATDLSVCVRHGLRKDPTAGKGVRVRIRGVPPAQ